MEDLFNIDNSKLPQLTFNEEAGRHMLKEMMSVKEFGQVIVQLKVLAFLHYCENHLHQDVPKWFTPENMTQLQTNLRRMKTELTHLVPVWERSSAQIDRHVYMLVCMYASFSNNLVEEDNTEFVDCGAYVKLFTLPAISLINGHMFGASMLDKFHQGLNPKDAFNAYTKLVDAEHMMSTLTTHRYVKDAIQNEHYGEGTIYRHYK